MLLPDVVAVVEGLVDAHHPGLYIARRKDEREGKKSMTEFASRSPAATGKEEWILLLAVLMLLLAPHTPPDVADADCR